MNISRSCLECRRRKIRCDRNQPCSYCIKNSIECEYPTLEGPSNRRQPRTDAELPSRTETAMRMQRLEEHVQQLEARLASIEGQPNTRADVTNLNTPFSDPSEEFPTFDQSELATEASFFALRLSPHDTPEMPQWTVDYARLLWQIFLTDIDPCMKILNHQYVEDALLVYPEVSQSQMVVLLAVDFAVTACKHPSSTAEYNASAKSLERGLQAANVLSQPNVQLLQSLTIYLICGRLNMEPEYTATMLLLLIRLASRLQLNQDPEPLGFSERDCEHRRRLWWNIVALDVRTAESCGSEPFIVARQIKTRIPSMIPDSMLNSDTNITPANHAPCSFFGVMGFEMANVARRVLLAVNSEDALPAEDKVRRLSMSDQLHQALFNKHVKHCNCVNSPVCRLTVQWAQIYWARLSLLVLYAQKVFLKEVTLPADIDAEKDLLTCINILERVQSLRADAEYSRWDWLWFNSVEWDASSIALCIIAADTCSAEMVRRAWTAMDAFFDVWSGNFGDQTRRQRWHELLAYRDWVRATHCYGSPATVEQS